MLDIFHHLVFDLKCYASEFVTDIRLALLGSLDAANLCTSKYCRSQGFIIITTICQVLNDELVGLLADNGVGRGTGA
jgi:hypothetical protein